MVQQSRTVSFAGLLVVRTLYMPMPMHKVLILKIGNCVFYKSSSFYIMGDVGNAIHIHRAKLLQLFSQHVMYQQVYSCCCSVD